MDHKLLALYGHWCNADAVRIVVSAEIPDKDSDPDMPEELSRLGNYSSSLSRLVVWYSLLYVVVEGYIELKLRDPIVDELLGAEKYVDTLRLFRNATFHYQKEPISEKAIKFLAIEDSEKWIRSLNRALNKFFLERLPIKEQMDAFKANDVKLGF